MLTFCQHFWILLEDALHRLDTVSRVETGDDLDDVDQSRDLAFVRGHAQARQAVFVHSHQRGELLAQ